jgi:hypothetical protein
MLILLTVLLITSRSNREVNLEFTPNSIDLGFVSAGKTVSFDIHIINQGSSVVMVHGVKTSCDCTSSSERTFEILPKVAHSLLLTVLTQPESGRFAGEVVIFYGDKLQSKTIKYRGLSLIDSAESSEQYSDTSSERNRNAIQSN